MKAVLNVGHSGCVGSILIMLKSLGYEVVHLHDRALKNLEERHSITPNAIRTSLFFMGYERPPVDYVGLEALDDCDLYIDIKEESMDKILELYPRLKGKSLHFVINGGKKPYCNTKYPSVSANMYTPGFKCFIPFLNWQGLTPRKPLEEYGLPVDFLHNAYNWGFGDYIDGVREMGVRVHGDKGSPDGLIHQVDLKDCIKSAKALVHMKGSDSPGYALYEAFASGVPVIVPQLFVDRMKYQDMYINGETCLTFGSYAYEIIDDNPDKPIENWNLRSTKARVLLEIQGHLDRLEDPKENHRIGLAGYNKWRELTMWTEEKAEQLEEYLKSKDLL
jgi:hypothetical protein